jgi:hypothetical protein
MNTRRLTRTISAGAVAIGTYAAVLAVTRPWHRRWGATDEEIERPMPGDELSERAAANHAITIAAPIDEVWPWLVQIGQDRAGFYSYTVLENLIGADIHNSNRIVPEWQSLKNGDHIRLASEERFGLRPLLRVSHVQPGRSFVLEGWGAFALEPIDEQTTRMIIRTHRTKRAPWLRVLDFFIGEPAHFIMERGMLRGIKKRAERNAGVQSAAA